MAYQQSAAGRPAVQESYGTDARSSSNVGLPNSARGEGTTTSEMVAKLRFFNCTVCAYLILFHFLPLVINPIRLAFLLKSPTRLVLAVLVGTISFSMFTTEAQVPIVAEKILYLFRKCRVGNMQLLDLDTARGRVVAITVMTMAIGMMNHLNSHPSSSSHNPMVSSDPTKMDDNAQQSMIVNWTNSSAATLNETTTSTGFDDLTSYPGVPSYSDGNAAIGFLFAFVHSTIFSFTMWMLLALLSYTIYVIVEYPSYSEHRAFAHVQDDTSSRSSGAALSPASSRSWVSNIPDFSNITGRGGYQSVNNPIQMNV
ncbi:hypothetical protein ACHAXM_007372 [Skeletonema potamos]|jgi:hypothetical protein